ncbi:hypothetical protein SscP1EGY_14 [Streptomyces phage SscP1EGY]|nr:hypothetical protein SscP1EGY_14 [Streptomyces phage SscP1EGY]
MDKKPEDEALNDMGAFMSWLDRLDDRLMNEVIKPNETYWSAFQYFDSVPWRPLNPREFLQFWGILTEDERLMVLLEIG